MFINPIDDEVDVVYKFPKVEKSILAGIKFKIGNRTIVERVLERRPAGQALEHSVTVGENAIKVKECGEDLKFFEFGIGKVSSHKKVSVEISLIQPLIVPIEGSLKFILPLSYFPQLQPGAGEYMKPITFNFSA